MIFTPAPLAGAAVIDLERHSDERGSFARAFCAEEFASQGLPASFPQANLSSNPTPGTLRGMHFVHVPPGEAKVVRCVRGALFDVIVDLRVGSSTRWEWFGAELSADNGRAVFVPSGFAHGYVTIEPTTDVLYLMSRVFDPGDGRGIRWDDPAVGVDWPRSPAVMSDRDATYPDVDVATFDLSS